MSRERARNPAPPKVKHAIPPRPGYLSEHELWAWRKFEAVIDPMKVSTAADFAAFEALVCCYSEMVLTRKSLRARGALFYESVSANGAVTHRPYPEVVALHGMDTRMLQLLGRFGLTPADRTRVTDLSDGQGKDKPADPEAEFTGT